MVNDKREYLGNEIYFKAWNPNCAFSSSAEDKLGAQFININQIRAKLHRHTKSKWTQAAVWAVNIYFLFPGELVLLGNC